MQDTNKKDNTIKISISSILQERENNMEESNKTISKTEVIKIKKDNILESEVLEKIPIESIKEDSNNNKVGIWLKEPEKEAKKEPEWLFNNYESDFKYESTTIIDKLKKIAEMPKTRPVLIFWLLWFTILASSLFFTLSPSDSILKADILWITKEEKVIEKEVVPKQEKVIEKIIEKDVNIPFKRENTIIIVDEIKLNKIKNFLIKQKE